MRDTQLDNYRALMMIHVIFCHVMYWLMDGCEPFQSFALFAMAGAFFIAGASVSVRNSRRGLWETVLNRFERVVLPFYIYATVIIVFSVVAMALAGDNVWIGFERFVISEYGWKDIVNILLCQDVPGAPFSAHIWFLQPYLILSCTFPLQVKQMERTSRHIYFVGCLLLFLALQAVTRQELLREVACYNVFMVAGFLYYRRLSAVSRIAVGACAAAAIVAYVVMGGHFCPMQGHKFPPDWVFTAYGIFALCAVSMFLGQFKIPSNRFLGIWNTRGFNIYLYQSVVFVFVATISSRLKAHVAITALWLVVDCVFAVLLATVLSFVTYPLEQKVMKAWRKAIIIVWKG
ncbi:MAG: acyltransferase family protein [Muribaculaceae bacterium]|nr:acyltransferase family protein [Muribaculaceae bacterium]MBQ7204750.1 acyltransferase family protein [Muribaculaceae bacterium]